MLNEFNLNITNNTLNLEIKNSQKSTEEYYSNLKSNYPFSIEQKSKKIPFFSLNFHGKKRIININNLVIFFSLFCISVQSAF